MAVLVVAYLAQIQLLQMFVEPETVPAAFHLLNINEKHDLIPQEENSERCLKRLPHLLWFCLTHSKLSSCFRYYYFYFLHDDETFYSMVFVSNVWFSALVTHFHPLSCCVIISAFPGLWSIFHSTLSFHLASVNYQHLPAVSH